MPECDDDVSGNVSDSNIAPFRMVLHKVTSMKIMYSKYGSKRGGMDGISGASHFALMWIPTNLFNTKDGVEEHELNEFINAMRESGYFVNKLNEKAVYISGPSYGSPEHVLRQNAEEVW